MDRAEHLQWCKDRALEYVDGGDLKEAVASMMSDLGKHPETAGLNALALIGLDDARKGNTQGVRDFITGFN